MKFIKSPYFYIPVIIAAVILIWFWFRAVQCKWQCNFWTGKPKASNTVQQEGSACSTTVDINHKDGIIKNKKCVPAHLDSNLLLGKKIKISDPAGTAALELNASTCLIPKNQAVLIASGTELDILEAKIIPVNACNNSDIIKAVRTESGWFDIKTIQII